METKTLANLATNVAMIEVDGERAETLEPKYGVSLETTYLTADEIAKESGISQNSPRYSGMHHHCQYSRTC